MKKATKVFLIITSIILVLAIAAGCIYYFLFYKKSDAGKSEIPTTSASSTYASRIEMLEDNFADFSYRLKFVESEDEYFRNSFEEFRQDFERIKEQIKFLEENEEKVSEIEAKMQQLENKLNNLNNSLNLVFSNYSNTNLLINGDFRINQRGCEVYRADTEYYDEYSVDRWKLSSGAEVRVVENGIILTGTITQIFENPPPTGTLTASVDKSNGTVSASYENGVFSITASNVLISWAKLEVGTKATAFVPKTKTAELADCQRFFLVISSNIKNSDWQVFGSGVSESSTKAAVIITLPVEMRKLPEFSFYGQFRLLKPDNVGVNVGTIELDPYSSGTQIICLKVNRKTGENNTMSGTGILTAYHSNAGLVFDAEIYY